MAQQTLSVTDTPSAVAAVQTANGQSGDTLQLANSVTLTQVLPEVTSPVTFDSNGFTLTAEGSGALVTTSAATLSFIGAGTFSGPSGGVVETTTSGAALTNAASLTAQTNDAAAVDFSAPGTLNNSGSITGPVGAFWYSTGAVANTGSITATTSLAVEILGSDTTMSTVTNSGDLTGASYGVGVSGIGTVTNTGVITSPVFGIVLDRDGNSTGLSVVNNNAGGAISGQEAIYLLGATATVNNAANASINGTQIAIYATHGAVIANAGTISSPSGGSDAIDVSGGGSLTNSGSISSAAPAVTFGAAATISNNAGGSITGARGGVVLYSGGAVSNAGTISGGTSNAIYGVGTTTITNSGTLSSAARSGADAIYVSGGGSLANSGAITGDGAAVQFTGSASVTNSQGGTITGNTGSGIFIEGAGTLTNAGTLSSTNSSGAAVLGGGSITNTGTIIGAKYGGVQLGSSSNPAGGTLTNSGVIQSTVDGNNGAALIGAGSVVANNSGGLIASTLTAGSGSWGVDFQGNNETLTNAGTIKGDVGVVFDGSGTLTNAATGVIYGATTGVSSGAGGTSGAVSLTSGGSIQGGAYAIQLTGNYNNTLSLLAGSVTTGLISTGGGDDSLTLVGISAGGINLGGGNNTLTLVAGATVGGTLDGGAGGTNALILTGATVGTLSAAQLADFSTVTMTGTGTWDIKGLSTLNPAWTLESGTVQISNVKGLGTAPVADNATLSLYGASGAFTNAVSGLGAIYVTGVGAGNTLTFSGDLTNTGATGIASLLVLDGSHIAISGANTSGAIGVDLGGTGGTLDVLAGASVVSAGDAVYGGGTGVTVNNAGTLVGHAQNGAYGAGVDLYEGGTLNNSGSVTGDDLGVELGQTGAVNNALGATITGLDGNAIYALAGAAIVNNGTLQSGASTGYDAVYVAGSGSLSNTGVITGDGAAVQFNGAASVTNAAGATITGNSGSAIYLRGTGVINNAGGLSSAESNGVAILQGGTITNTGTISGAFGGVQVGSSSYPHGGTVTNSGTIQATAEGGNGATLIGDNSVITNNAGGLIAAPVAAGSGSWGVDFEGNTESLTNAGTIKGDVGVVFDGSGTLVNAATGVISGATTGVASGAGGTSGAVSLTSSGAISGGTYSLQLTGDYNNTISLLPGSVTLGLISTDSGNDSVALAGTSAGGVNLGGGNNILTLTTGASAGGTLDGGAGGVNALILAGATSGAVGAEQLVDFSTVIKIGAGAWALTGSASALSAAVSIQQGILSISSDAALGSGALTIAGGGELQVTATTGGDRSVTIAGAGADIDVASGAVYSLNGPVTGAAGTALNVNNGGGAGTLAFNADNSAALASDINLYGGTISAGASGALGTGTLNVYDPDIDLGSGVTLSNPINLHAALTVNQAAGTGGLSGVISESVAGSGLTKTGAGILNLSGVNTYTGATTISGGVLALVGAGSIAASSSVIDNGTLDISQAASGGASIKSLSGAGAVSLGASTLTLTAAADLFSGSISGAGGLTLAGGTETLTGTSTYSGATMVSGGSLVLDGSLPNSTVMVENGGSVQGAGMIANLSAAAGSTLSPGGAAGVTELTPSGHVTLAPGSVYQVTATAAGQSDLIAAGGAATVTDAVVRVEAQPGTYARSTAYTILTAAGGVTGTFAGVTTNYAFLTPALSYMADAVDLTLYNNGVPFQTLAATPNQAATAAAIYASNPSSALYNAVLVQTSAGAQQAFNALSGEIYATAPIELLDESHYVRDALLGRMRQAADGFARAGGAAASDMGAGPLRLTAWGQVIGAWASNDSQNPGVASSHANTGGGILGVDGQARSWRLGLALAQLDTTITVPDRQSQDRADSSNVAVYAAGPVVGALQARVGFNFAWDDMHSARTVAFPGFLEDVGANYHSQTEDGFGELGYALRFKTLAVEPYANLAYVNVHTGALAEPDGVAALQGAPSGIHGVFGDTGVRFATRYAVSEKVTLSPYLDLGWRHLYGHDQTTADLTFESTGQAFQVVGAALDPNAGKVETGVAVDTGFGMKVTAAYLGQISRNWQDNQVKLALSWAF